MSLSEKGFWTGDYNISEEGADVFRLEDVKQAVKELKKEIAKHMKYCIGKEDININKIFGDKLI